MAVMLNIIPLPSGEMFHLGIRDRRRKLQEEARRKQQLLDGSGDTSSSEEEPDQVVRNRMKAELAENKKKINGVSFQKSKKDKQ